MPPLTRERWRALLPKLERAMDLPEEQRRAWLDDLRAEDPSLASDLEELLEERRLVSREGFLERGVPTPAASLAGQTFGAYTLESLLGQGGMGNVWLARRSDGRFEGKTAVKLLNASLLGPSGEERFRREGSILARLTHPHIARLLDAGVAAGQPYLVLEYVDGAPIDRWCDERRLDVKARLRLFRDVLESVAHAHANLVVHRDIKPSNVLVTHAGEVKLLDFGIAKLLETGDGEGAPTRETARALTPEFAAPEQLTGGPVTTATDVHALGTLLYILLGGRHPAEDALGSPSHLLKAIVDTEPRRLSTVTDDAQAARRSTTPDALRRSLKGDLETIVAKALKKDPSERYASVTALAEDVLRVLEDRPIAARPDTLGYRAAKFVRRNRTPVALAALVLLALLGGLFGTVLEARRATRQAARAEAERTRADAAARAASAQRDFALRQLSRAEAINDLNAFVLSDAAPSGKPFTLGELLARAERVVDNERGETDENRVEMLLSIGLQYWYREEDDKARRLLGKAYDLAASLPDRTLRAKPACALAATFERSGGADRASALLEEGLAALPAEPAFTVDRTFCLLRASEIARGRGDVAAAVARAEEAQRLLAGSRVSSPLRELTVAMDVAESYRMAGRPREASEAFRNALGRLSSLGRDETEKAGTLLNNWGLTLQLLGRPLEAEAAFRRAVAISTAGARADAVSPMLLNNLARALVELKRLDEAAANAEHAYEKARRAGDDVAINQTLLIRTASYRERGELDRAERTLDEVAPRIARMYAPNHIAYVAVATERSMLALARGDLERASRQADEAVDVAAASAQSGEALPRVLVRRANVRTRLGRHADARADAARAVELERAYGAAGAPSSRLGRAYAALAGALQGEGKAGEARAAFASALENLEPTLGAGHPDVEAARRALGYVPGQTGAAPAAKR